MNVCMNNKQQLRPGSAVRRALRAREDDADRRALWQQRLSDYVGTRPTPATTTRSHPSRVKP